MFVDIQTPVMHGFLFISELQESPETFDIPIVTVSAIDISDVRTRGEALGVKESPGLTTETGAFYRSRSLQPTSATRR